MLKIHPEYLYSGAELGELVANNGPHWATVIRINKGNELYPNYKILVLAPGQGYDPVRKRIFDLDPNAWLQRLHKDAQMFGMSATDAAIQAMEIHQ